MELFSPDKTQAATNPSSGSAVVPQTGDDSNVTLCVALLLVSGVDCAPLQFIAENIAAKKKSISK